MSVWGLKNSDLTFVRREIRGLLLQYISRGDAWVEYFWWLNFLFESVAYRLGVWKSQISSSIPSLSSHGFAHTHIRTMEFGLSKKIGLVSLCTLVIEKSWVRKPEKVTERRLRSIQIPAPPPGPFVLGRRYNESFQLPSKVLDSSTLSFEWKFEKSGIYVLEAWLLWSLWNSA